MVLEETASKLFAKKIVQLLLAEGIDINKIPRIVSDFARLQMSSVHRERMKAEMRKKVSKAADEIQKAVKSKGLSDKAAKEIRKKILGIAA